MLARPSFPSVPSAVVPKTVGKRTTPDGVDYKYTVTGRGMDGKESTSIIYVTVGSASDSKPEFTQVVR